MFDMLNISCLYENMETLKINLHAEIKSHITSYILFVLFAEHARQCSGLTPRSAFWDQS